MILIDVSNIFYCEAKHGVFMSEKFDWNNILPVSSFVIDIDIDCSSNLAIFDKELRCSHSEVIPPACSKRTQYKTNYYEYYWIAIETESYIDCVPPNLWWIMCVWV